MEKNIVRFSEDSLTKIIKKTAFKLMESKNSPNPKYTHFAVDKNDNKIVNGWDYTGVDHEELKSFPKDYFSNDLSEMGVNPKNFSILTKGSLAKRNIDPSNWSNWKNAD